LAIFSPSPFSCFYFSKKKINFKIFLTFFYFLYHINIFYLFIYLFLKKNLVQYNFFFKLLHINSSNLFFFLFLHIYIIGGQRIRTIDLRFMRRGPQPIELPLIVQLYITLRVKNTLMVHEFWKFYFLVPEFQFAS